MRLPPQVSAVRRERFFQPPRALHSFGVYPLAKPTNESITCWGTTFKQACICTDSHNNPVAAACCKQSDTCSLDGNGLCACA